jgi:hypothetical protein
VVELEREIMRKSGRGYIEGVRARERERGDKNNNMFVRFEMSRKNSRGDMEQINRLSKEFVSGKSLKKVLT